MTRYYKWMADGRAIYGTGKYAPIGEPQPRIEGFLKICVRGYHVCTAEQVPYWCGTELWEVEVADNDIVEVASDKVLCRTWTGVRKLKWLRADMVDYAKACAERARCHAAAAGAAAADTYAAAGAAADADAAAYADADAAAGAAAGAADAARAAAAGAERRWQREWIERRIGEEL